jgi:hypothetical protein
MGLVAGLSLTLLLAALIPRFNELIVLSMSTAALFRVTLISALLGAVAALLCPPDRSPGWSQSQFCEGVDHERQRTASQPYHETVRRR